MNFRSLENDYCPLYSLLAVKPSWGICAIFVDTHTRVRIILHTRTHTCIHVMGTFPTGALVYVNCIRNSEYPVNFLHTDHSRISAKRTSIRRSLHHKFRCTWCNAHLVEAPRVAFVMHQTSALLSLYVATLPYRFTRFPCFRRLLTGVLRLHVSIETILRYSNFPIVDKITRLRTCSTNNIVYNATVDCIAPSTTRISYLYPSLYQSIFI